VNRHSGKCSVAPVKGNRLGKRPEGGDIPDKSFAVRMADF
jgi:hypothetical protein